MKIKEKEFRVKYRDYHLDLFGNKPVFTGEQNRIMTSISYRLLKQNKTVDTLMNRIDHTEEVRLNLCPEIIISRWNKLFDNQLVN